jgi:hypothetical protein
LSKTVISILRLVVSNIKTETQLSMNWTQASCLRLIPPKSQSMFQNLESRSSLLKSQFFKVWVENCKSLDVTTENKEVYDCCQNTFYNFYEQLPTIRRQPTTKNLVADRKKKRYGYVFIMWEVSEARISRY